MDKLTFVRHCMAKYGDAFDYSHLPESIKRVNETIICKKHGKLEMIPRDHLRSKHGCPHCASEAVTKTPREINRGFIHKAKEKHKNKFKYNLVDMETKPGKPVTVVCPRHGKFKTTLKTHLHSETGCFKCGNELRASVITKYRSIEDVTRELRKIHGDKYTYIDYNPKERTIVYVCSSHGEVTQVMDQHLLGKGCRHCFYDSFRITPEKFMERVKEVHPEGYTYDLTDLTTVNQKIKITHKCGRVYKGRVSNHLNGQGCLRCKLSSLGEDRIKKFLEFNDIPFIDQYVVNGYRYRYDFYLPELNILVEYDGQQHFKPVDYFGGEKAHKRRKEADREKNQIAKLNGHTLIRIPYWRFDDLEVCLSRAIDYHFKYRVNNVFYRKVTDLCDALNLPGTTNIREVEHHRTFRVLKPA